ncbi:MotA/TolQ/ExbB proton channel family protein [Tepidamorphus sp. 3E244]|uniref:MotA/TolQ/ExbB proton channel family protein n=1 Tax=Tepidamorphus sp. 3E244 TaxID=3385498 RepID=UPI0038FD2D8D
MDVTLQANSDTAFSGLTDMIALGGPVVAILLVLSVVLVALILVKLWQFHAMRVGRNGAARRALDAWLRNGDKGAVANLAGDENPASRILVHAVTGAENVRNGLTDSVGDPATGLREDLERIGAAIVQDMRRYLRVLETLVQVAPLLGLFGTVVGMIEAFRQLQESGARVDPSDLAGGIWIALLTTAAGLLVAMPANIVLNWFESRIARQQLAMEDMAISVLNRRIAQTPDADAKSARIAA